MNVKLVEKTNDNRAGHYGEDNNIYLNDAKINNTKDLATTIGHETSHAMDDQDINTSTSVSASTNQQNDASKTDNEIYADNYGDDFGDFIICFTCVVLLVGAGAGAGTSVDVWVWVLLVLVIMAKTTTST